MPTMKKQGRSTTPTANLTVPELEQSKINVLATGTAQQVPRKREMSGSDGCVGFNARWIGLEVCRAPSEISRPLCAKSEMLAIRTTTEPGQPDR